MRKDGLVVHLITHKSRSLYEQGIKPAKLTWTTAWRRLHKKGVKEDGSRSRKRRVVRTARAIQGMSVEDIQKKKKEAPQIRQASKERAAAELKARAEKKAAQKASQPKGGPAPGQQQQKAKAHVSKNR